MLTRPLVQPAPWCAGPTPTPPALHGPYPAHTRSPCPGRPSRPRHAPEPRPQPPPQRLGSHANSLHAQRTSTGPGSPPAVPTRTLPPPPQSRPHSGPHTITPAPPHSSPMRDQRLGFRAIPHTTAGRRTVQPRPCPTRITRTPPGYLHHAGPSRPRPLWTARTYLRGRTRTFTRACRHNRAASAPASSPALASAPNPFGPRPPPAAAPRALTRTARISFTRPPPLPTAPKARPTRHCPDPDGPDHSHA